MKTSSGVLYYCVVLIGLILSILGNVVKVVCRPTFPGSIIDLSSAQLPCPTCQVRHFSSLQANGPLLPLAHSAVIIICAISCNHLMIGLRRVDGSLARGVTEVEDPMVFAPRRSSMVRTTSENADFARTRATDCETAWDVELSIRRSTGCGHGLSA